MTEDEQFVREHWEIVGEKNQKSLREAPRDWHGFVLVGIDDRAVMIASGNHAERWPAAAAFTRERLEQIRLVEEEIEIAQKFFPGEAWLDVNEVVVTDRILLRLQAALSELKKGLRDV